MTSVIVIVVLALSLLISPVCLAKDDKSKQIGKSKDKKEIIVIQKPMETQKGNTCLLPTGKSCKKAAQLPIGSACCCSIAEETDCNGRIAY